MTAAAKKFLDLDAVRASAHGRWPDVLTRLGIGEEFLRNKHGPCPACGGKDRFRFDDKDGRGTWLCTHCGSGTGKCGAGDGFKLLMNVHGWTFPQALREVADVVGMADDMQLSAADRRAQTQPAQPARPTARVQHVLRTSAAPELVPDVSAYLTSRRLWPLPAGCTLRAHAGVPYFDGKDQVGLFPALLAEIVDNAGERVSAHVTYLRCGRKVDMSAPRKILSPLTGRIGCCVRLMPMAETLGIAEGIETALAANRIHSVPVWSALNTSLLVKFEPPPEVKRLIIFADRDPAGLEAAWHLRDKLSIPCELKVPPDGDWNDVLVRSSCN